MSTAFAIARDAFAVIGFLGCLFIAALICEGIADNRRERKREAILAALDFPESEDAADD